MTVVVGVIGVQELAPETTYLETDLNTGECRNIAVKPKASLLSSTKLTQPESRSAGGGVSAGLQSGIQTPRFPGQRDSYGASSQSSLPEKSAAFGHHGGGSAQNVTASGYSTPGTTVVIGTHSGNPPVTGAGFPPVTDQKLSSEATRPEPRSGVYSLASSRLSVQQMTPKPGSDAGNWADRRLGPDAATDEGLRDDSQHRRVVGNHKDHVDSTQPSTDRKQMAANVPSVSVQVILLILLYFLSDFLDVDFSVLSSYVYDLCLLNAFLILLVGQQDMSFQHVCILFQQILQILY